MAETVNSFDSLPVGTGYASVPAPSTDAAPDKCPSTVHVLDSFNDAMQIQVVSIATQDQEGPANPAPYWNSGEKETLTILE